MNAQKRIWEIDFLRGIAVTIMIIAHLFMSMQYFGFITYTSNIFTKGISIFAQFLFFSVVGISLTISYQKRKNKLYLIKRGIKTIFLGMIVTLLSGFVFSNPVLFGTLHFIGTGIILSSFFIELKFIPVFLSAIIIPVGIFINNITISNKWLFWLGLKYPGFTSLDYFPILPWLGIMFIGLSIGNIIYTKKVTLLKRPSLKVIDFTEFLGRNALIIYFIHSIILVLIMIGIKWLYGG